MKRYKISAYETVHARFIVETNSKEEALVLATKIIEEDGMPDDARVFDREYEASMAEEIK
jgi:hypothetical protein